MRSKNFAPPPEAKVRMTQIDGSTFRFTEAAFGTDVYLYLLIGAQKALLIDTGYGFTDVPTAIRKLTSLPLLAVNTHGHMDHMHGNHLYPFVYLAKEDEEVFTRHNDSAYLMGLLKDILRENRLPVFLMKLPGLRGPAGRVAAAYPSVHRPLPEEGYFELGERRVTIIPTPGHTAGSLCLLDERNGWLFSGDTTCRDGVLLHFPESTDVATFKNSIQTLKALVDTGKIKKIFPGHQETPVGMDILDTYLEACELLLSGQKKGENGVLTHNGTAIRFDRQKIGGSNHV